MSLIDRIKSHAVYVANLTYGPSVDGHRFTVVPKTPPLTEQRGVYFLLSHNDTQIQKVGLANGIGGLRQRMAGYRRIYRGNGQTGEKTMALWYRKMTAPLRGQTLSLWVIHLTVSEEVVVLGKKHTLLLDPHPEMERVLIQEARCSNPLELIGQQPKAAKI
jgi:hypothetical protein